MPDGTMTADDRRVEEDARPPGRAHLLEHHQIAAGETAEDATMIKAAPVMILPVAEAERDRLAVVAGLVERSRMRPMRNTW